ncbi:type III secretion system translocon subunit SctE [Pseudomonas carnis]|uniref:type III secretion system translocon subunit SctE n=1 Tax=Pseudomonas TaxID=286 RepID=UPI000F585455|nr:MULTISPECIES: type III secretion system translocon subunit SctE [Pseudomonas]AZC90108.1 hypothetical protein C4K29_3809 [Pseudomonas chlororaphis subsp. piscium]MBY8955295.1 type III secretion system translocon subunit SctE [Pseudomonas carnis]
MPFSALYTRTHQESPVRQAGRERYTEAASKAANTKAYQRAADTVLAELQSVNYIDKSQEGSVAAPGRPRLAPPVPGSVRGKEESQDIFTLLMASLITLLGEGSMESLKSRLSILKSAAKAASQANQALQDKYDKVLAESDAAIASASGSEEKLASAKANLERAERDLSAAEKALGEAEPNTPEHDKALAERDLAQGKVIDAQRQSTKAEAAHIDALKVAGEALKKAEALAKELEATDAGKPAIEGMKTQINAAAKMTLLMMQCAALMGESAETKIGMEQELFQSMQAARQVFLEKKSEEYLEEVKKAEAASKTMGCIGKIIGAVLLAVSVISLPFTAGASLAISVAGIALMAGDMLVKQITGVSFMEEAMKPLMENVLAPLIDLLGKGFTKALEAMGVDPKKAEMAGKIMGAIYAAVIMVTVMLVVATVGKSAASRLGPMMGKVLGKSIGKLIPGMVKQASRSVTKGFTKSMTTVGKKMGLKTDSISLAKTMDKLEIGMSVVEAGSATAQAGMGVKAGIHQRNAAVAQADFQFSMVISDAMKTWLGDMVQQFDQTMSTVHLGIKKAMDVQSSSESTSLSMARNI